jgi:signal transduction histidine kinase
LSQFALPFARSDAPVVAGVCSGLAERIDVDPTLVRLVFAVLSLAGGAGILLYFALWAWVAGRRPVVVITLSALSLMALLLALGFQAWVIVGVSLMVSGVIHLTGRGASLRPGGGSWFVPGIALTMAGAVLVLQHFGGPNNFVAPGALAGALILVLGPWVWQLVAERGERIRLAERAEIAARIHDSVLQTLALVQRDAEEPARVRAVARRQERELRRWLYGSGYGSADTFADALAEAAADIEGAHDVPVELASSGDAPLDERLAQLVLAAREAMANAAKHSGAAEIAVYAEVDPDEISVFVRDRGAGFDPATIAPDRRGLAESVEARLQRAGGSAAITSAVGEGTEIELRLPR